MDGVTGQPGSTGGVAVVSVVKALDILSGIAV